MDTPDSAASPTTDPLTKSDSTAPDEASPFGRRTRPAPVDDDSRNPLRDAFETSQTLIIIRTNERQPSPGKNKKRESK